MVRVEKRTLAYWPGRRLLPGFANSPATRMAPVLTSTCAIRKVEGPVLRIDRPIRQNQLATATAFLSASSVSGVE